MPLSLSLPPFPLVDEDENEWEFAEVGTDAVLHIELRKWADAFLVAPLSANTLGKLANGLCDNLLCCVARAWDFQRPFIVCPAMNTMMWDHPFTAKQLQCLQDIGCLCVEPRSKLLACGDYGTGALASLEEIIARLNTALFDRK